MAATWRFTLAQDKLQRAIGAILEALKIHLQNQPRAAKALGLSREGLIYKMKRYIVAPGHPG